jgi:hypothetical protein
MGLSLLEAEESDGLMADAVGQGKPPGGPFCDFRLSIYFAMGKRFKRISVPWART